MNNKLSSQNNKFDVEEFLSDYKVKQPQSQLFARYLEEVFIQLSNQSKTHSTNLKGNKTKDIDSLSFSKYYELPGMISKRLFAVFDSDNNDYLSFSEFVTGMLNLFTSDFKHMARIIFTIYDFDKDGFISKEDIKVVFSYIPTKESSVKQESYQVVHSYRENNKRSFNINPLSGNGNNNNNNEEELSLNKTFSENNTSMKNSFNQNIFKSQKQISVYGNNTHTRGNDCIININRTDSIDIKKSIDDYDIASKKSITQDIGLKINKDDDYKYMSQLESKQETERMLEIIFNNTNTINFDQFMSIVENSCSEVVLYVLIYLLENKPFNNKSLLEYSNSNNLSKVVFHQTPNINKKHLINSPAIQSKFAVSDIICKSPLILASSKAKINYSNYNNKHNFSILDQYLVRGKKKIDESNEGFYENGNINDAEGGYLNYAAGSGGLSDSSNKNSNSYNTNNYNSKKDRCIKVANDNPQNDSDNVKNNDKNIYNINTDCPFKKQDKNIDFCKNKNYDNVNTNNYNKNKEVYLNRSNTTSYVDLPKVIYPNIKENKNNVFHSDRNNQDNYKSPNFNNNNNAINSNYDSNTNNIEYKNNFNTQNSDFQNKSIVLNSNIKNNTNQFYTQNNSNYYTNNLNTSTFFNRNKILLKKFSRIEEKPNEVDEDNNSSNRDNDNNKNDIYNFEYINTIQKPKSNSIYKKNNLSISNVLLNHERNIKTLFNSGLSLNSIYNNTQSNNFDDFKSDNNNNILNTSTNISTIPFPNSNSNNNNNCNANESLDNSDEINNINYKSRSNTKKNDIYLSPNVNEVAEAETEAEENFSPVDRTKEEIQFEGYIFKISKKREIKKLYYKLIDRDLFVYKHQQDKNHFEMNNLSGVFFKEGKIVTICDNCYYCFSLEFKLKNKVYFVDNECEYNSWCFAFKSVTRFKSYMDKYEESKRILGKGKFGIVKLGLNSINKEIIAIKIINKNHLNNEHLMFVKTEIDALKICYHPNIIRLREVCENQKLLYLIMDYCSGGCLMNYLERYINIINEKKIREIVYKVLLAVDYLHNYGIVHRDLKPNNILMVDETYDSDIKIIDFGLSKIIGPKEVCIQAVGSLGYAAPEVLEEKPYNFMSDMWSIGVITYLLLSKKLPFDSIVSTKEIVRKTISEDVVYDESIWSEFSVESKDFVNRKKNININSYYIFILSGLLVKTPKKRLTMEEALEHPWMKTNPINFSKNHTKRFSIAASGLSPDVLNAI